MGKKERRQQEALRTAGDGSPNAAGAPAGNGGTAAARATAAPFVPGRADAAIFAAGTLLVGGLYLILKSFSLNAYAGDEHIYLYQAKLVADGFAPYRDFFMAHPPFQALLTAAVFKVAGYHFLLGRLLPIVVTLAGGVGLGWMARRELGAKAGVAAMALSLLAYEPLRASTHFTGVETAVTLLVFAWLAARKDRMIVAAALCVAAVATRLYAIPGVAALVIVSLLRDGRRGLRLVAAGAAIGAVAFAAIGLWTGFGPMAHDLFLYHADKTPMGDPELLNMRASVLFHNAVPAGLFALSLPALVGALAAAWPTTAERRSPLRRLREAAARARVGLPLAGAFAAILMLAILLNLDRVWMYYFVPSFPFAALASGWLVALWIRGTWRIIAARGRLAAAGLGRGATVFAALALVAFGVYFALCHRLERYLDYWEEETAKPAEARGRTYTFRDGAIPALLDGVVRAAIWRDERVIGERYSSFTYYLWHESRAFDVLDDAVAEIRDRAAPDEAIFGDSGTVPLLALLSERAIAGREVDTNIQRYRSGNAESGELLARIDVASTKLLFLRSRFGVAGLREVKALAQEKYRLVRSFRTDEGQLFQLFERRSGGEGGAR